MAKEDMKIRLLNNNGQIFDLPMTKALYGTRLIEFHGRYYVDVGDNDPDGKWVRLYRETPVSRIRDTKDKSFEEKKKEYLERAQKQLDESFERGVSKGSADGFHRGMELAIACVESFISMERDVVLLEEHKNLRKELRSKLEEEEKKL